MLPKPLILSAGFIFLISAVFALNINLAKSEIKNWNLQKTVYFIVSISLGQKERRVQRLKESCDMDRDDAIVFIGYQEWCLIELFLGCLLLAFFLSLVLHPLESSMV